MNQGAEMPVDVNPRHRQRGKELAKSWGLKVKQALYRKTGDWYHQLQQFQGALLDADGFVIFQSEEAFKSCPRLHLGKDPLRHGGWVSAPNGIKAIPGYTRGAANQADLERECQASRRMTFVARQRSCAGPASGELEQIQMLLGHASVQTTERYLGTKQDLVHAPNDGIKLRV
jgi:hypothetical protein